MQKSTKIAEMPNVHPAVVNCTTAGHGGRSIPQQKTMCSHPGCDKVLTIALNDHQLKPFKAFRAAAAQRGWAFDGEAFSCPDHKPEGTMTTQTKSPSEAPPREMTREQRRAIFREIDDSYDKNGYCMDVTDQSIADKLSFPCAWVEKVREENFGPAGADPRLKALVSKVEAAEATAQKAYDGALAAAEKAEKAQAEVKALKDQLLALLRA
jgi:hypothetical protein